MRTRPTQTMNSRVLPAGVLCTYWQQSQIISPAILQDSDRVPLLVVIGQAQIRLKDPRSSPLTTFPERAGLSRKPCVGKVRRLPHPILSCMRQIPLLSRTRDQERERPLLSGTLAKGENTRDVDRSVTQTQRCDICRCPAPVHPERRMVRHRGIVPVIDIARIRLVGEKLRFPPSSPLQARTPGARQRRQPVGMH
jgi:hypothetical protein